MTERMLCRTTGDSRFLWRWSAVISAVVPVLVLFLTAPAVYAQTRSSHFDDPGRIVLPDNYDDDRNYPLLILLPYTGGTAEEKARAFGFEPGKQEDAVLLLPEGRFYGSDYLPDFLSFVDWFEQRLYSDISAAVDAYSIDPGRIYLAGYSLGGDMSWALTVRNPEDFAGAIIAGSRSSHPVHDDTVEVLADSDFRAAFLIGDSDTPNRYKGLNHAHALLERGDVKTIYREYPGGHELPPQDLSVEALEFISDHESGRISAAGSDWPGSTHAASVGQGNGFFGMFRESREPSGRIRVKVDIPVAVSRDYDTGVGFARDGRHALVAETLYQRWWFYGDVALRADHTSVDTYNSRVSSTLGIAYGDSVRVGAVAGWDYVRWLSNSGGTDSNADLDSGTVFRRQYAGLTLQVTGGRRYIPRAGMVLRYTIPTYLSPASPAHLINADLSAFAWPTEWLYLTGSLGSGTRQYTPADGREHQHDRSERALLWEAGVGLSISEDALLSVSYRGNYLSPHSDEVTASRDGYNEQWRLGLRYALY